MKILIKWLKMPANERDLLLIMMNNIGTLCSVAALVVSFFVPKDLVTIVVASQTLCFFAICALNISPNKVCQQCEERYAISLIRFFMFGLISLLAMVLQHPGSAI